MTLRVEGDLRFASHHDTMRSVERLIRRAGFPIRYSQGYNPRPTLSLPFPRPVGVASRDDLLVVTASSRQSGDEMATWAARFNERAPRGMTIDRPRCVPAKPMPRPVRAEYRMACEQRASAALGEAIDRLERRESWWVERAGAKVRRIDLRPLVEELGIDAEGLRMVLLPHEGRWAKPGEVLGLVGLDGRVDLAKLTRTDVVYEGIAPAL